MVILSLLICAGALNPDDSTAPPPSLDTPTPNQTNVPVVVEETDESANREDLEPFRDESEHEDDPSQSSRDETEHQDETEYIDDSTQPSTGDILADTSLDSSVGTEDNSIEASRIELVEENEPAAPTQDIDEETETDDEGVVSSQSEEVEVHLVPLQIENDLEENSTETILISGDNHVLVSNLTEIDLFSNDVDNELDSDASELLELKRTPRQFGSQGFTFQNSPQQQNSRFQQTQQQQQQQQPQQQSQDQFFNTQQFQNQPTVNQRFTSPGFQSLQGTQSNQAFPQRAQTTQQFAQQDVGQGVQGGQQQLGEQLAQALFNQESFSNQFQQEQTQQRQNFPQQQQFQQPQGFNQPQPQAIFNQQQNQNFANQQNQQFSFVGQTPQNFQQTAQFPSSLGGPSTPSKFPTQPTPPPSFQSFSPAPRTQPASFQSFPSRDEPTLGVRPASTQSKTSFTLEDLGFKGFNFGAQGTQPQANNLPFIDVPRINQDRNLQDVGVQNFPQETQAPRPSNFRPPVGADPRRVVSGRRTTETTTQRNRQVHSNYGSYTVFSYFFSYFFVLYSRRLGFEFEY